MSHGQLQRNRVARKFSDKRLAAEAAERAQTSSDHRHESTKTRKRLPVESRLSALGKFLQVGLELVVLVLDGVEEEALGEIRLPLFFIHLADQVLDLLHQILEAAIERALGRNLAVQR